MPESSRHPSDREPRRLADQLERAFEGDAWHGSSISEILAGLPAEIAVARPIPGVHSIWEIVVHMSVWQRTVSERLAGQPIRKLSDEEDWPPVTETSQKAWGEAVRELREEYERLRAKAASLSPAELDETLEGERYTIYQMLHGVLQHGLYHAGQIAILKKLPRAEPER